jgi:hypothetical protein
MPGGRVDGHAGRLVDDEQVLVLVDDGELRHRRGQLVFGLRSRHLELLPTFQPMTLRAARTVDPDRARREQPLGRGA